MATRAVVREVVSERASWKETTMAATTTESQAATAAAGRRPFSSPPRAPAMATVLVPQMGLDPRELRLEADQRRVQHLADAVGQFGAARDVIIGRHMHLHGGTFLGRLGRTKPGLAFSTGQPRPRCGGCHGAIHQPSSCACSSYAQKSVRFQPGST
ncbi:hypothetical protein, partial [Tepidiforma sp.]|uniref:hypothetical protein n=1 Tax=Tepidiforma sp. TaxID=2682230 RepID=UPI002ADE694C